VSAFFIPGVPHEPDRLESAYRQIRRSVEAATGHRIRERRIFKLDCRRHGTDYEAKVGGRDAVEGETVIAIFDLGAGVYAIRCAGPTCGDAPIVVGKRQVYSVTEFTA
jgi:hypothetical protein